MAKARYTFSNGKTAIIEGATREEVEAKIQDVENRLYKIQQLEKEQAQAENEADRGELSFRSPAALLGSIVGNDKLMKEVVAPTAAQSVAGVGQAVTGVAQAVTDLAAEGADRLGLEGAEQSLRDAGDFLAERRQKIQEGASTISKDAIEYSLGRSLSEMEAQDVLNTSVTGVRRAEIGTDILLAMAPASVLNKAKTFTGALALGATEGFLTTALTADTEGYSAEERNRDRAMTGTVGALLGGFASGVTVGLPAGLKNMTGGYIRKILDKKGGVQAFRQAQEDAGGMMTVGQFTEDPTMLLVERNAAGDLAQEALRRQKSDLVIKAARDAGVDLPPTMRLGEGLQDTVDAYVDTVGTGITKARKAGEQAFRNRMAAADALAGGQKVVRLQSEALDEVLGRTVKESLGSGGTRQLRPEFMNLMDEISKGMKDGATARQISDWQIAVNRMRADGVGVFKVPDGIDPQNLGALQKHTQSLAGDLSEALKRGIDGGQALGKQGRQALKMVQQGRRAYGERMRNLANVDRMLVQDLGLSGRNPKEMLSRMQTMDPKRVRSAVRYMQRLPGGRQALGQLKEAIIHKSAAEAAANTARTQASGIGGYSLDEFLNAYARNSDDAVSSGLLTPAERALSQKTIRTAQRLLNADAIRNGVIKTHLSMSLQDLSINAMSRDPGFMARLLARVVETGKGADWLFYTPEGLKILQNVEAVSIGGKTSEAAIAAANAAAVIMMDMVEGAGYEQILEQDQ